MSRTHGNNGYEVVNWVMVEAMLMEWHVQAILDEAEELLEKWKHPDPYRHPTAPGGMFGDVEELMHLTNTTRRLKIRTQLAITATES
jgi:hypothetical protein